MIGALARTVYPGSIYGLPPRGRQATLAQLAWPNKRSGAVLDYNVDFTCAIGDSTDSLATIAAAIVACPSNALGIVWGGAYAAGGGPNPLVINSTTIAGNIATLLLAGGTPGSTYVVTVTATTTAARVLAPQITVYVDFS